MKAMTTIQLKAWFRAALTGVLLVVPVTFVQAANFKVATVAPPGTSFHKHLQDLSEEWEKAPGGGVSLNIYPGTQGGESQIVRRMRLGQLQGAMLTAIGMSQIDESAAALQLMPMEFRNWGEVDFVRDKLESQLEEIFLKAGYVVLFWGDAGWVRFFSTKPINNINDLKGMRVYAASGSPEAVKILKEYYNPVELEPDKILLSLRNGMIDAVPIPPFLANFSQVATKADNMLDMKWAPVAGAMVLTKKAWDSLVPETQKYLRETGQRAGEKIRKDSRREDDEAIEAMVAKQGLKVTKLTDAADKEWRDEMIRLNPKIRGNVVPAQMFDSAQAALKEYRANQ
jgi:TRAP-type C4-dicarboxylate transport system substrate-binding protein